MRSLLREDELAVMLGDVRAVLYLFVDWSTYAVEGRRFFEELESDCSNNLSASFWFANVSSLEAPAAFIDDWLKSQEHSIFLSAACGNGPILWLNHGGVIDFVHSASHYDVAALRHRTKTAFH